MRILLPLLLAPVLILNPAEAADVPYEYYRWYYDEPIELIEQPGQVLILAPEDAEFSDVQRIVHAAGYQVVNSDCPFTSGSRHCVQLRASTHEQLPDIRNIIDDLLTAEITGDYFFAPVFEGPVSPLGEVLIGYENDLTEAGLDEVIRAAGFTGEYTIVRHYNNGPYVIDPNLKSGIETLELGNAIYETGLVFAAGANLAFTGGSGPVTAEPFESVPVPAVGEPALWILTILSALTGAMVISPRHPGIPN